MFFMCSFRRSGDCPVYPIVQFAELISFSMDSGVGSSNLASPSGFQISDFLTNSLSKPNFLANWYMIAWSVCDSNSGVITRSRHCSERFDAVTEPEVSNWVQAGSRYTPSLRTIAAIAAVAEGYGS